MGKKLKIGSGGLSLEADLADAFFIMSEPLGKESEIGKLNVNIEESTKLYDVRVIPQILVLWLYFSE